MKNDLAAEHSCIMVKPLKKSGGDSAEETNKGKLDSDWIQSYYGDFKKRFLSLLSYEFREVDV